MAEQPMVRTTRGVVRGRWSGETAVFAGVPYAAPPVGEDRFAPPRPRAAWEGVHDGTGRTPAAPQPPSRLVQVVGPMRFDRQDEDCLAVTVTTPSADPAARLPVLVWLHGGAFTSGAGGQDWYDAEQLAARGMVVVSVTYRLGALGFLYLAGLEPRFGPGNLGLRDQAAALEWVGREIEAFGGDPDRVTVAGQSAGALTALILATRAGDGARPRRLILQSLPGGLLPATPDAATEVARIFLSEAGIPADQVSRLRDLPLPDLLRAQLTTIPRTIRFMEITPPYQLVADGDLVPADPVAAGAKALPGCDLLIGTTAAETNAWYALDPAVRDLTADRAAEVAAGWLGQEAGPRALAERVAARPAASPAEAAGALADDWYFGAATDRLAAAADGFRYRFDWCPPGPLGACHCMELPFVFGTEEAWRQAPMLAGAGLPANLVRTVQDSWTAFVQTGDPGPGWYRHTGPGTTRVLSA